MVADNWGADQAVELQQIDAPNASIEYCLVEGWTGAMGGVGKRAGDPLFYNAANGDYRLTGRSGAIDSGNNDNIPPDTYDLDHDGDTSEPLPVDLAGNPRQVDELLVDDTGVGTPPIVDMGAYEGRVPTDCNGNGVDDVEDVTSGASADCDDDLLPDECAHTDCNANGVPDLCDLAGGMENDCNGNRIPDSCEITDGSESDCNYNEVPDSCDIASGTSNDCDGNGLPDECDPDCNSNGVPDTCDITNGSSPDCNNNGVPDECDVANGTSPDCNNNDVPDKCDIEDGTSEDCNDNHIPDECDIADGTSLDCNSNGIPDDCDILQGNSHDCNGNRVPDECDIADGFSADTNHDGIPDECQLEAYCESGQHGGTSIRATFTTTLGSDVGEIVVFRLDGRRVKLTRVDNSGHAQVIWNIVALAPHVVSAAPGGGAPIVIDLDCGS